jgi:RHS repeat-associated protein
LISEEQPGVTARFIQGDFVGSPNIITDGLGNVVGRAKNLPFGERLEQRGEKSIRRYTNHEDEDGSAIYMQARTYLPVFGRFGQVDPMYDQRVYAKDTWNLYGYVANNPVTTTDPDGKDPSAYCDGDNASGGSTAKMQRERYEEGQKRAEEERVEARLDRQFNAIARESQSGTGDLPPVPGAVAQPNGGNGFPAPSGSPVDRSMVSTDGGGAQKVAATPATPKEVKDAYTKAYQEWWKNRPEQFRTWGPFSNAIGWWTSKDKPVCIDYAEAAAKYMNGKVSIPGTGAYAVWNTERNTDSLGRFERTAPAGSHANIRVFMTASDGRAQQVTWFDPWWKWL